MSRKKLMQEVEKLLGEKEEVTERLRMNDYIGTHERSNDEIKLSEIKKSLNKIYIEKNGL
jgi:ParB-like chromosome segregation protein Spo0J